MVDARDRAVVPTVSVFRTLERAIAFVTNRATDLVERGDFEHAGLPFQQSPPPMTGTVRTGGSSSDPQMAQAPQVIECCVFEIRLRRIRDGQTCTFRVTQHPVT